MIMNKFLAVLFIIFSLSLSVSAFHEKENFFDMLFNGESFFDNVVTGYGILDGNVQLSQNFGDYSAEIGRDDVNAIEVCNDGIDNDGDGYVDCADHGSCDGKSYCGNEVCNDKFDNDGDGYADCEDQDSCDSIPPCGIEMFDKCNDGIDNDNNGLIDCDDYLCISNQICLNIPNEICDNNIDDDGDGLIDCSDVNCVQNSICISDPTSSGVAGNNGGNTIDSEGFSNGWNQDDDLYKGSKSGKIEDCKNGKDDDGDGKADCEDSECSSYSICIGYEDCEDGVDNDEDGKIDCQDEFCSVHCSSKIPEICDNGLDDDGDGLIDCGDVNCFANSFCTESNKQFSKVRELTKEERSEINIIIERVSSDINIVASNINRFENGVSDSPVAVQYVRHARIELAVAAGRLLRLGDEARKNSINTETVRVVVMGIRKNLRNVSENIADASLVLQREKWEREESKKR